MMLKLISKIVIFSVMFASLFLCFLWTSTAMLTTGTIELKFNVFHEGWLEVFVLGVAIIPSFIYLKENIKQETKEYAKTRIGYNAN